MKLTTKKEVLLALAQVIEEHPHRWCQGALARNKDEDSLFYNGVKSKEAYSFCVLGMVQRLKEEGTISEDLVKETQAELFGEKMVTVNDRPDTTPASMAAALRKLANGK